MTTAAGYLDAVIAGAESVLSVLDAAAVLVVRADLEALRGQARDLQRWIEQALSCIGDPAALRAAASAWSGEVAAPVSALTGLATLNTTEVDDHWAGLAADAYRNTLPAQAAEAGIGEEVNTDLVAMADAITVFWGAVGIAGNTLILGLAVALAGAATVAGAPLAVAAAIGAITLCAATLTAALAR